MTKHLPTAFEHRAAWKRKRALREIYHDYYKRLIASSIGGLTLEVGAGGAGLKNFVPEIFSLDIQSAPWLDIVANAQHLPFADQSLNNIVLVDVLHHLPDTSRFISEAIRTLIPGGRLAMIEPGLSLLSRYIYDWFHHEDVDMSVDPLAKPIANFSHRRNTYWEGNVAIPTLIFSRDIEVFRSRFPEFRVMQVEWLSIFVFPLSGGYQSWSLIPESLAPALLAIDNALSPNLGRLLGYRLHVVLERQ